MLVWLWFILSYVEVELWGKFIVLVVFVGAHGGFIWVWVKLFKDPKDGEGVINWGDSIFDYT